MRRAPQQETGNPKVHGPRRLTAAVLDVNRRISRNRTDVGRGLFGAVEVAAGDADPGADRGEAAVSRRFKA